jgi:iron(II)-dependent oxidoreductase
MKRRVIWVAFPAMVLAVLYYGMGGRVAPHIPADLRDAVADNSALGQLKGDMDNMSVPESKPVAANKGYVEPGESAAPIKWVTIPGGKFTMGTSDVIGRDFEDAKLVHQVTIKTFQMAKTDITVAQYAECVVKGVCTEPAGGEFCNWGKPNRGNHPVNCVDWNQAQVYAKFKGARLPSEAEWEYAATSGGKNQKYPWGNDMPTCDRAIMYSNSSYGCGKNSTWPVCSKPAGNTAQGLCDMSGNVWQWVQDVYADSYAGAPVDGSAVESAGLYRVTRGGSFFTYNASIDSYMRADFRSPRGFGARFGVIGFRLAR